jgi:two-component system chemotaxis sensor kinase CheA
MDMSAFVRRFSDEAAERVMDLENEIARLETNPGDKDLINHLMRQAHTVKGGARMLRLKRIQDLAHAMEDAMSAVGQGKRIVTPVLIDALMASGRGLRKLLAALDPDDTEPEKDAGVDVEALSAFVRDETPPPGWGVPREGAPPAGGPEGAPSPGVGAGDGGEVPTPTSPVTEAADTATTELESALRKVKAGHSVRVAVSRLNDLGNITVEMTVERAKAKNRHRRLQTFGFSLSRARASTGGLLRDRGPLDSAFGELDRLHRRMVEESEDELSRRTALDQELRDHVQSLRLTPLKVVFDPFPASVREIARGLGKEVDLVIKGAETELDRRIVDELGEPLVHLVRNALDHGIEGAADRERAGKPRRGRLEIRAWSAEGAIFVEVADDGKGIDPDYLRNAAVARGVLSREDADRMTEEQAVDLIFLPGFSTRDAVGELSGRGVGMDSVRVAIGRLGGIVSVSSEKGKGTRSICRLPLTLALLRVLLFRVGGEVLAVPLNAAQWCGSFATVGSLTYEEEEGQPLPVVSAAEILGFTDAATLADDTPPAFLIIASAGSRALFVVDEVLEEAEVALKEAPAFLRRSRLVAGVTLLGTGSPAVVVEPSELLARAMTRRARPVEEEEKAPAAGGGAPA